MVHCSAMQAQAVGALAVRVEERLLLMLRHQHAGPGDHQPEFAPWPFEATPLMLTAVGHRVPGPGPTPRHGR